MQALETSFFILTQYAFCVGQEAENEFKVTCDPLKQRFSTLPKSHFGVFKGKKMTFKCHSTT